MSELTVGSLSGLAANSYVIDVASGSQLTQPGMILQVVSAIPTSPFATTSSSFVDVTGYSVSITPISSTSTIVGFLGFRFGNSSSASQGFQMLRGATSITTFGDSFNGLGNVSAVSFEDTSVVFTDTPATTSATTYQMQVKTDSGTLRIGERSITSNERNGYIVLWEVAA